ncbi:hypothetical protein PIB30_075796 [Stylosanthes scabra]|uniref:Uncharacterized protein n=1 Tax=Stylosanthes scabra TaxID=79078 RepID=A0ABU6TQR9_9FABA|nr:hypothetical protein [Stylosanthes scabra]
MAGPWPENVKSPKKRSCKCFLTLWRGRTTSTARARGYRYLGCYEMGWHGRAIWVVRPRHQRKTSSLRKEGAGAPCKGCDHALYEVGSGSAHIPLESSHGIRFQSPIQNDFVSSSADHLSSASPTCVLDWPNGSFEGTYRIFGGGVRSFDSSGRLQNDYGLSLVYCVRIGVEHFVEGAGEVDTMDESSL